MYIRGHLLNIQNCWLVKVEYLGYVREGCLQFFLLHLTNSYSSLSSHPGSPLEGTTQYALN